ncbi:MAG: hypothetical protein BroJett021_27710 [Chloroflexota bacterium]|nr:hypothetical protein [Caldilinea sp.]GIK73783.1 MAG: hypothetical protein BroJett021_27710 [Chloroflexota bacterium]
MNVFSRSWSLFKSSWSVMRSEPSLLWFPVLSALLVIIASVIFFGLLGALFVVNPAVQQAVIEASQSAEGEGGSPLLTILGIVVLFIYYLIVGAIATYFATAMAGAALRRLDGQDTSFGEGIKIANSRLGTILGFSAISATVGVLLSLLRNNRQGNNPAGAILAAIGGMAWTVATFLVIPVIADRQVNAIGAIKESALLLRKTWGEQIVGSGGLGLVFGLASVIVVILTGVLAVLAIDIAGLVWTIIAVGVVALIVLAVLNSTLSGIYKAAVYRYAAQRQVAPQFDATLIEGAFRLKGAAA